MMSREATVVEFVQSKTKNARVVIVIFILNAFATLAGAAITAYALYDFLSFQSSGALDATLMTETRSVLDAVNQWESLDCTVGNSSFYRTRESCLCTPNGDSWECGKNNALSLSTESLPDIAPHLSGVAETILYHPTLKSTPLSVQHSSHFPHIVRFVPTAS